MDILATLLPPAVIIGVILFTSNQNNKRIDDLRSQMTREHDALAKRVDETNRILGETNKILIEHITDRKLHSG